MIETKVLPAANPEVLALVMVLCSTEKIDMRKRCFAAAKAAGCTQAQLDAILAVPIEEVKP